MVRRTTTFSALVLVTGSTLGYAANSKGSLNSAEKIAAANSVRQNVLAYLKSLPGYTSKLTVTPHRSSAKRGKRSFDPVDRCGGTRQRS